MAGLTSTGFVEKSVEEILDEVATAQRASPALGSDFDTSAESPAGQINAALATQLGAVWETAGVVYRSRSPRDAQFAGLDAVCSLTGTVRRAATKGTVTLTVNLNAGRTLPAGSVAHVAGDPANRWVTLTSVTNSTGAAANVTVNARAEAAGVFVANAGTITSIATPVTGWNSVTNLADAAPGAEAETDGQLRARRLAELFAGGTSPVESVRAALSRVTGVSSVAVAENDTDETVDGMPPHSLRAVVQGGTDDAVALALWRAKAGGIRTVGETSVVIVDAMGANRTVNFTRPTTVNVYLEVTVVYDAATYAGDAKLKAALVAVTTGQLAGQTLRKSAVISAALALAGVTDCTRVRIGRTSGSLVDENAPALFTEVLKITTGRITVVRGYL